MPMRVGFADQRRMMLEAELERIRSELPLLGIERAYLIGRFANGEVGPETGLDLLIVQRTDEPFHRRADFFTNHVVPRLDVSWFVYTPEEFEHLEDGDPLVRDALRLGEEIYAA